MPRAAFLAASGCSSAAAIEAAIVLKAGDTQSRQTVAVNETLPGQEFLDRKRITLARFLEAEHARAHGCNDLGLASDHPTLGFRWRKSIERDTGADFDEPVVIALADGWLSTIGHWLGGI